MILEIIQISAKKGLNTLNKIKDAEIIKYKNHTLKHKELLNLFNDLLDIILTGKILESESQEDENENDKTLMWSNNDDENKNENDKTLMSSKDENEDEDDDETMSQNKKNKIIERKNDILDEIIDKSKSFEEQIKSLKKQEDLKGFWPYKDFGDKELKSKYFKIEFADISNDIDEKLFEQILVIHL